MVGQNNILTNHDSPFMGGRMMDSPYLGRVQDSPFLRAQEAKYGQASGFSLGPGMHEAGASEGSSGAVDTPQSTADLTAFANCQLNPDNSNDMALTLENERVNERSNSPPLVQSKRERQRLSSNFKGQRTSLAQLNNIETKRCTPDEQVQNLLQQMQLRFQSMSDAIIVRIDEMASRIEDLEKAVDEVLREVTADEDGSLPSPSTSPMRKPMAGPASPDIRKLMSGSGSFSGVSVKETVAKYGSSGTPEMRRQVSAAASLGAPGPKSPDPRRHSGQGLYAPSSPDPRRHSAAGIFSQSSHGVANSPDVRRQTLPGTYAPTSPDVRKNTGVPLTNVPSSPDPRRRTDTFATGMR